MPPSRSLLSQQKRFLDDTRRPQACLPRPAMSGWKNETKLVFKEGFNFEIRSMSRSFDQSDSHLMVSQCGEHFRRASTENVNSEFRPLAQNLWQQLWQEINRSRVGRSYVEF